MDYNTIKEQIMSFSKESTNDDNSTNSNFQKSLSLDEISIVGEALSNLKDQELLDELLFLIDNVNMENSIDAYKAMLLNYRDELLTLIAKID